MRTRPSLKQWYSRGRPPSPAARASFDQDRISLDWPPNSLKVELTPFSPDRPRGASRGRGRQWSIRHASQPCCPEDKRDSHRRREQPIDDVREPIPCGEARPIVHIEGGQQNDVRAAHAREVDTGASLSNGSVWPRIPVILNRLPRAPVVLARETPSPAAPSIRRP
jgi:hypothetical protein